MTSETVLQTPGTDLWSRVLRDSCFDDLPYKVETNERGQIILSPHKPEHSFQQMAIAGLLMPHMSGGEPAAGKLAVEFAVATPHGVKVPDVIWISMERAAQIPPNAEASPAMPELAIEVLSESNTRREMDEKRAIYFAAGAQEVWTCDPDGRMRFYGPDGELETSEMVPSFPALIS